MKIAAIDLGSNSIHMVVVEVRPSGGFRVVDRETEMVRLGAGTLASGRLPETSIRAAIETVRTYKRLAEIHEVDEILAVATSAIREARNGQDFLRRLGRKVGVWAHAISGEEEARFIYLAALHSVHLDGGRALVADLGGGSLELALGRGPEIEQSVSEKLGVLRMTERFVRSDPIAAGAEEALEAHARETLGPHAARIRRSGFETMVGTSGTILALGRLALEESSSDRPESLHHVTVSRRALSDVRRRLTRLDLRSRLKLPGLDRRRADLLVAGSILLDTLLDLVGAPEVVLCEWALREGVLLDYLRRHPKTIARAHTHRDVRRRSVLELAERFGFGEAHSRQVARLAVALFDAMRPAHGLGDEERSWLEHAALLHDVGHLISHSSHHKHSYYLIKHGDLRGFSPVEIEILANIARYHRRGIPKRKHRGFGSLPPGARERVRILAGLLRVADELDRGHRQRILSVEASRRGRAWTIRCLSRGDVDLERWGVRHGADLLESALGGPVRFEWSSPRNGARRPARARGAAACP